MLYKTQFNEKMRTNRNHCNQKCKIVEKIKSNKKNYNKWNEKK